jgi:putative hydrolase of the HAD superfamily
MRYRNLFFDLDDTLWAFSQNSRETFEEMYHKYEYDRFFRSFSHFYELYEERNIELWRMYGRGQITKEELNKERFTYPLRMVGVNSEELVRHFATDYFSVVPTKSRLMPYAREVLEELSSRYHLYILSNGFRELQSQKMRSSGIDGYFRQVLLSDDIGILKPNSEIYYYALATTRSKLNDSLMIGDNWDNDISGARDIGMHQVFYDLRGRTDLPFRPTFTISDLRELTELL